MDKKEYIKRLEEIFDRAFDAENWEWAVKLLNLIDVATNDR